jgi:hypothetical protein
LKIKKLGVIDTVYKIGDKVDCSCSIGSPDGRLLSCIVGGLICCIVGLICCIVGLTVGSWKVVIGIVAPGVGTPLQSLNRFNAAVMSRFMSAIIDVTFTLARIVVSTAAGTEPPVALIIDTISVICAVISARINGRIIVSIAVIIAPIFTVAPASMAAHISKIVASAPNPKLTASCC